LPLMRSFLKVTPILKTFLWNQFHRSFPQFPAVAPPRRAAH